MSLNNLLLLSQIAGYVVALILSLCVLVPMIMHHQEFKGHCLLFSSGEWQEADGQLNVEWASTGYCNYTILLGLMLFIVSSVQIYRLSRLASRGEDSSFLATFVNVVLCINLAGMTIIGAAMVTLGFITWCEIMTERFPSCETAAGRDVDKRDNIDTSRFYIEIGVAQFGAWGSFACWVGLGVMALIKLCRHHQLENIRVSMYHERQRLVKETNGSIGNSSPVATLSRREGPDGGSDFDKSSPVAN